MIKTAAGWVIDLTRLDVGDFVVLLAGTWPHNYNGLEFKQASQYMAGRNDVYLATVNYKPNTGMTIATQEEPRITVFKATPSKEIKDNDE